MAQTATGPLPLPQFGGVKRELAHLLKIEKNGFADINEAVSLRKQPWRAGCFGLRPALGGGCGRFQAGSKQRKTAPLNALATGG